MRTLKQYQLECGPMPNVMVALPNIGGALCSTPQSLADAHYKTRNRLKFAGVPQTTGSISAASGPKFTILWGHLEDILLLKNFFSIVDMCLSCEDIARQSCAMVPRWRFLTNFCVLCFQRATCSKFQPGILSIRTKATPCVKVWQTSNL